MKRSRSQYQVLTNKKLPFEISDLSKHPIKNLQLTINILTDQKETEEQEEADTGEALDTSS